MLLVTDMDDANTLIVDTGVPEDAIVNAVVGVNVILAAEAVSVFVAPVHAL